MIDRIDELELASLRSGRDEYSRLKLSALMVLRPQEAVQIAEALPLPSEQASALRWVLRGESVERAIAKVILDRESIANLRDRRRAEKDSRESLGMTADEIAEMKMHIEGQRK
jgi:hypothetical protein